MLRQVYVFMFLVAFFPFFFGHRFYVLCEALFCNFEGQKGRKGAQMGSFGTHFGDFWRVRQKSGNLRPAAARAPFPGSEEALFW